MRLKAVVSVVVSLMFALTVPTVGITQSENGQPHPDKIGTGAAVVVPESTIERPEDVGLRAHTNHLIRDERRGGGGSSPSGETPASLRAVYNLPSTGGGGVIAIVDAFDYPTAENDLNVFSTQFGLPACTTANGCFKKVFASGVQPRTNCGWAQEAALDIEWAHAMTPNAKIILVEAATNSFVDLFAAVDVATNEVVTEGGILTSGGRGEVSMSWGGREFGRGVSRVERRHRRSQHLPQRFPVCRFRGRHERASRRERQLHQRNGLERKRRWPERVRGKANLPGHGYRNRPDASLGAGFFLRRRPEQRRLCL